MLKVASSSHHNNPDGISPFDKSKLFSIEYAKIGGDLLSPDIIIKPPSR